MNNNSIFKPALIVYGLLSKSSTISSYPVAEYIGDSYWEGGMTPKPYRWEATISISSTSHSSSVTRQPFAYNGLDIYSGMWISDSSGNALKIISILRKTESEIVVIVEDVDRVNTFRDISGGGNGFFVGSSLMIFELDDESLPVIPFVPSQINAPSLPSFISSRFQQWNPNRRYKVEKLNHESKINDVVVLNQDTHHIESINEENSKHPVIGTVIEVYKHHFFISPVNRVVEGVLPALPGNVGDYIYVDPIDGSYTNTATSNRVYIKLTNSIKTFVESYEDTTPLVVGTSFKLNEITYQVSSSSVTDLCDAVNADTITHGVTMTQSLGATTASSNQAHFGYGIVGIIHPQTAIINGVTVNFTTDASGSITFGASGMSDVNDIVVDINAANIPNITAKASGSILVIENHSGGTITIENTGNDGGGTPFAGAASNTGLPFNANSSAASVKIQMERLDGGPITLENVTGFPLESMKLFSVQNGKLPSGMIVENWNRISQNFVVGNISERDGIHPIFNGDSVMVLDKGNGEWGMYTYINGSFVITATEDSARTDADVLTLELDYRDTGPAKIGTVSDNSRVTDVTIEVLETFDSYGSISIGDFDNNSRLMSDSIIDLESEGTYSRNPSHVYSSGGDTDLFVYFNFDGATKGRLRIILSYS